MALAIGVTLWLLFLLVWKGLGALFGALGSDEDPQPPRSQRREPTF